MIRGYEAPRWLEPEPSRTRIQWWPAIASGLIAGIVLLIVPHGSPWEALTFFSPSIMGRTPGAGTHLLLPVWWLLHLAISVPCGVLIAVVVAGLRPERAVLAGGLMGLVFYAAGFAAVTFRWSAWRGGELGALFANLLFGFVSAAAYVGLLRRKAPTPRPSG